MPVRMTIGDHPVTPASDSYPLHGATTGQRPPLELKVPNRTTAAAMREAEEILAIHKARFSGSAG